MFSGGGGQFDLQQMLQQAQQLQQQLLESQAELAKTHVTGTAGGGSVKATVTGAGELVGLEIAPEAVDPLDPETLETLADLVIAAVRDANVKAQQLQASSMDPLAQGLGGLTGLTGGPGTGEAGPLDLPRE